MGASASDAASSATDDERVARPARLAGRTSFLQIVAHPDDDLYFMNPDVADSLATGGNLTTVVLTAAEAGGGAAFAAARQHGLRSAYAVMAGSDKDAPWRRTALVTRGGVGELCELAANSSVRLVFLDIVMGGYAGSGPEDANHTPLAALWTGAETVRPTLQPVGSVAGGGSYTREQLIGTLADLMDRFQPTVVRTLDPDPERRVAPFERAWATDSGVHMDNEDHTATAWFTYAAYAEHATRRPDRRMRLDAYVGYGNARWKHNLSGPSVQEKLRLLSTYGWADHRNCGDPAGCGDRTVGSHGDRPGWSQSTNLRHPGTTEWLRAGPDGRLRAFAVVGGRAVIWTETAAGSGAFGDAVGIHDGSDTGAAVTAEPGGRGTHVVSRPPVDTTGTSTITPHLAVAVDTTGLAHLVGLRATADPVHGTWTHEIVVASERPDGGFTPWTNLGAPTGGQTNDSHAVGCPTAAVDGRGVLHVFARNADKSVSWRFLDAAVGAWSAWRDIGGQRVRDGLTAVVTRSGDIELHANGHVLWTWRIGPSGAERPVRTPLPTFADPPTARALPGGGQVLAEREPDTGRLVLRWRRAGALWTTDATGLDGDGAFGVVAVQPHGAGVFVAQRGLGGYVETVWLPRLGSRRRRRWLGGPGPINRPSLALDANGMVVVAAVGPDALLYTARIDPARPPRVLRWTAWGV